MKISVQRPTVTSLVTARLAVLGATNIPSSARQLIEADVWASVAALIQRRVTAPVIGRAVARALAVSADTAQGFKGGTPLTSSGFAPSAQTSVAGHGTSNANSLTGDTADDGHSLPEGERL